MRCEIWAQPASHAFSRSIALCPVPLDGEGMALLLEFEKTKKVVVDALCSTPVWAPLNLGGNTGVNYMHVRSRVIPPSAFLSFHANARETG